MYLFLLCFYSLFKLQYHKSCHLRNDYAFETCHFHGYLYELCKSMHSGGGGSTARCCNLSFSDLSLADLSPVVNSRIVEKIIIIFKKERLKDASLMVRKADRNIEII